MRAWLLRTDTGTVPAVIDPTTGRGPEWGKAAPVALLIILLMGIALFLLIKSMNRQLRKVPDSFDPAGATQSAAGTARSASDTGARPGGDRRSDGPADQGDTQVETPPGDEPTEPLNLVSPGSVEPS